jgi:hypothetical protein
MNFLRSETLLLFVVRWIEMDSFAWIFQEYEYEYEAEGWN